MEGISPAKLLSPSLQRSKACQTVLGAEATAAAQHEVLPQQRSSAAGQTLGVRSPQLCAPREP